MQMGFREKLFGAVIVVTVLLGISIGMTYVKNNNIHDLSTEQTLAVKALYQIREYQKLILQFNLGAMDIIVDLNENPGRNSKVSPERVKDIEDLVVEISKLDQDVVDAAKHFGFTAKIDEVIKLRVTLAAACRKLIETINGGIRDEAVFAEFDESIDGSAVAAMTLTSEVSAEYEKIFKEVNAASGNATNDLGRTVQWSLVITLLVLWLGALPIIMRAAKQLYGVKAQLEISTDVMQGTSHNLSKASDQLASGSSQSASAIQESVSAMTEMASMLKQTANNIKETTDLVREVHVQSQEGSSVMADMTSSMSSISASNQRLKEIVKIINDISGKTNVINDIVFKTQLLAVNASIEAARAGQHGKGFSVVANEVSSLATLSGRASSEIRQLLAASSEKVGEIISETTSIVGRGESVSNRASESFHVIARSVGAISDRIEQIAEASREQETGIQQTTTALSQMNATTASTNESAHQNAKLSHEILKQSAKLMEVDRVLAKILTGTENARVEKKPGDIGVLPTEASSSSDGVGKGARSLAAKLKLMRPSISEDANAADSANTEDPRKVA